MTDQQPKLGQPELAVGIGSNTVSQPEHRGRTGSEAINAGLAFLDGRWEDSHWQEPSLAFGSDAWITACVLARLSEIPVEYKIRSLQRKIELSLDWLMDVRSPKGCWGSSPADDDAESTAWAVIALRAHGRSAPGAALDFLRRCRRHDGGFASSPGSGRGGQLPSAPEITALAIRALAQQDWATEDFLAAYLRTPGAGASGRRVLRFQVCAEILDWREGMASPSLLNQVRQIASGFGNEGAFDRSLLLRCLQRLRMQRAWPLAAGLRAMQMDDGSWSEQNDHKILVTVTAVSALALGESQPGLYFGSDLPLPRRLHQL